MISAAGRTDCLVVGAGPAGATIARLLALKGRDVIVADPGFPSANRLELLSPASLAVVALVGLEQLLDDPAVARRCLGVRRRQSTGNWDYEDFLRHPSRTGYVVDRVRFERQLRSAAVAAGVKFVQWRATGVTADGGVVFRESGGAGTTELMFANMVVDATGRRAAIARRRGVRLAVRDRMVAELMDMSVNAVAHNASWLDYWSNGSNWCYHICGPGGYAQIWRVRASGKPARDALLSVDASSTVLSAAAGEGWIAVGDAAIAFDPIASQGLFNALSSALVATGMLVSADQISLAMARHYSEAVTATFLSSEAGRINVYKNSSVPRRIGLTVSDRTQSWPDAAEPFPSMIAPVQDRQVPSSVEITTLDV
ncbi:FAD-dependent monooxygenase [Mesorhizobium sp. M1307]|uniref:NAD(P)/FAD-dependent oxidoreductase n=1 Tax=Mesorhizobium sp. M1307 TaxID=2957079 RepID=UPI00333BAB87